MCEVDENALAVVLGLVVISISGGFVCVGLEFAWKALRAYWERRNGR